MTEAEPPATSGAGHLHLIPEPRVLSPPPNFGMVEPGLYRSALPHSLHFSHLGTLRLRSVVMLSEEGLTRTAHNFFTASGVEVYHPAANARVRPGSWKPISDEVVKDALQTMLTAARLPALVCDVDGLHRVGMLVGCLRRLQRWNLNSAVDEYRAYAGTKTRHTNEQFIELYDIDLVTVPEEAPGWFKRHAERDRRETAEFREMCERGMLDEEGVARRREGQKSYEVFYYGSTTPLNSVRGHKPPRIEML